MLVLSALHHLSNSKPMEHTETLEQVRGLLRGELETGTESLTTAALDGSIFTITPQAVLYPKDGADIQAVTRFMHCQAEAGLPYLSLTARGRGSDQAGGPLNDGIIVDTTRHMTQILEIGPDFVRVQPGCRYGELQAELKRHGRYLPPYPASLEICTIGGAVANNSSGEKTVKYGDTRDYVESLQVVLANGDEVLLHSLNPAQLEGKHYHHTFEGKVYRELIKVLEQHTVKAEHPRFQVSKNATGYCLWEVNKHNTFDLCKLFVGSQGTLGTITEIRLRTVAYPKSFGLLAAFFSNIEKAAEAVEELLILDPSALEIVDDNVIRMVQEREPGHLDNLLPKIAPKIVLVIEFDDADDAVRLDKVNKAIEISNRFAQAHVQAVGEEEQSKLWNLRRGAAAIIWTGAGPKKALPIVEDGVVPVHKLAEFFKQAYALYDRYGLEIAVWGHAGDANLHMQPFMDLSDPIDREKIWPFVEEFHQLVIGMGGCISAEHNDGLLRAPYLQQQYGEELYSIFRNIKEIFDPHHLLNPGKKVDVALERSKTLVRHEYSMKHLVQNKELINR